MKDKGKEKLLLFFSLGLISCIVFVTVSHSVLAKEKRGFLLFFKYPNVTVSAEKGKIELDFTVVNTGERAEQVLLSIIPGKKAGDWDVGLETRWDKMQVHSVSLLPKEPDDSVELKFYAAPPEGAGEGKYEFVIRGTSIDGKIKCSANLTVNLTRKKATEEEISKKIDLTADYPSIENPAGEKFKFAIKVKNNTDKSIVMDLGADYPFGWRAYITPRWEEEKRISSIKVDANSSENLLFTLTPPPNVSKGEYPVKFAVKHEDTVETIDLKAVVTGTYELKMSTKTGRLSLDAIAGKEKILEVYLWNEGSAPIEDVSFFATDTPKDWKISFNPEKISSVSPYQEVRKPEKIKLSITTPPRTLPGDYMFSMKALGKQDQNSMDLRVTVKRSTMWGWVGIGIVGVIIAGLVGTFIKLGRR